MTSMPLPGWNIFKQIFADNWENFKRLYPLYDNHYYDDIVKKMLACGNPEKMGYIEYLCMHCGHGRRLISMSCKSTLCLRCGKVYVDDWVSQVSKMLHEGVIYRHIVLTIPEIFRKTFYNYNHQEELLGSLMRCGVNCMDDFFSTVSRKGLKGGYIVILQTHGRNGQFNPHLHIISTSGGIYEEGEKWVHLNYLPYPVLHKKWQWYLLEMLREEIDTEEIEKLVDYCYKRYSKGFVANVQKGDVPARYASLAKYLAKYVVSPPISVRRIDEYDGETVTYHYRSHNTDMIETEKVPVYTFIGRMIQHILPKGFKRIRYYGVQATKTFEKYKVIILKALASVKELLKGAVKIIEKKCYRERYRDSSGVDPLICRYCGKEMEVVKIWHPDYGMIFDEFNDKRRGKYVEEEEETHAYEENGGAIWPSSEGVQLPLFGVWN